MIKKGLLKVQFCQIKKGIFLCYEISPSSGSGTMINRTYIGPDIWTRILTWIDILFEV